MSSFVEEVLAISHREQIEHVGQVLKELGCLKVGWVKPLHSGQDDLQIGSLQMSEIAFESVVVFGLFVF